MARSNMTAKRVPNGTYGTVWLDGDRLAECYGCQGKVAINSEKLALCGELLFEERFQYYGAHAGFFEGDDFFYLVGQSRTGGDDGIFQFQSCILCL